MTVNCKFLFIMSVFLFARQALMETVRERYFRLNTELEGTLCDSSAENTGENCQTLANCGLKCLDSDDCFSFFYSEDSQKSVNGKRMYINENAAVDCEIAQDMLYYVSSTRECGCGYLVSGDYGIPDYHLTASSIFSPIASHGPERGRLNNMSDATSTGVKAWCSQTLDTNQWIQVELNSDSTVTHVTTQGRDIHNSHWVTSYKVEYSMDGTNWVTAKTFNGEEDQVFAGNTDRNTLVTNRLMEPFRARFVRLLPQTWHDFMCMRFDVIGCPC